MTDLAALNSIYVTITQSTKMLSDRTLSLRSSDECRVESSDYFIADPWTEGELPTEIAAVESCVELSPRMMAGVKAPLGRQFLP